MEGWYFIYSLNTSNAPLTDPSNNTFVSAVSFLNSSNPLPHLFRLLAVLSTTPSNAANDFAERESVVSSSRTDVEGKVGGSGWAGDCWFREEDEVDVFKEVEDSLIDTLLLLMPLSPPPPPPLLLCLSTVTFKEETEAKDIAGDVRRPELVLLGIGTAAATGVVLLVVEVILDADVIGVVIVEFVVARMGMLVGADQLPVVVDTPRANMMEESAAWAFSWAA